jgi:hypothetical protein
VPEAAVPEEGAEAEAPIGAAPMFLFSGASARVARVTRTVVAEAEAEAVAAAAARRAPAEALAAEVLAFSLPTLRRFW